MKLKFYLFWIFIACAQSTDGENIATYIDIDTIKTWGAALPRFLHDNRIILQKIYQDYKWVGPALIKHIRGDEATIETVSSRLADLLNEILSNTGARTLLQFGYNAEQKKRSALMRVIGGEAISAAIENLAPSQLGLSPEDAKPFAQAMSALLQCLQEAYEKIYQKHIKEKFDDVFTAEDAASRKVLLTTKISAILNDPALNEVIANSFEKLESQWDFISTRLQHYGFDPEPLHALLVWFDREAEKLACMRTECFLKKQTKKEPIDNVIRS